MMLSDAIYACAYLCHDFYNSYMPHDLPEKQVPL